MGILLWVVFGLIAGAIAKYLMPGNAPGGIVATIILGIVGAVVCTPPYLLGRLGLVMLGSKALFVPGLIVFITGLTLQAGATSAVKTVKLSASLVSGHPIRGADIHTNDHQRL